MTIQTRIHDGINIKTRTYRQVYKGKNFSQFREGFMSQADYSRWGVMWQLKGKQQLLIGYFGKVDWHEL